MAWTFLDYVDSTGTNRIKAWVEALPDSVRLKVKAKFNERLRAIATFPTLSDTTYTEMLTGACDGLMEIKFLCQKVQYRPLACYGVQRHEIVILIGAEERNDRFVPLGACESALAIKQIVLADKGRKHVVTHDFS